MTDLAGRLSDLTFALDKSIRYHQRRRGFFETFHRLTMFLVVITGSAGLLAFVGREKMVAAVAAVLGAVDLAYGPGTRARDHLILHQRFSTLLAAVSRVAAPTDDQLRDWASERLRIEADEPPVYWALEKDCHNEICFARGKKTKEDLNSLNWRERLFMQVFRFDVATPTS